ncbi:MAG: hypothetical protein AMS19_02430 [Gemmatimonas sp. SG8_23]|nr:MAG: hypothetical protein AMS19_02430 [Gemmatimonas sp. SG8_23]
MPTRPPKSCRALRCRGLVYGPGLYCNAHQDQELEDRKLADARRGTAAARGYGSRWRRLRAQFLIENPVCLDPMGVHPLETRAASVVDHIEPHRGDHRLFWDRDNWQALCSRCHAIKTARGE